MSRLLLLSFSLLTLAACVGIPEEDIERQPVDRPTPGDLRVTQMIPDWRHVETSPLESINEHYIDNPVLTAADVNDLPVPEGITDPVQAAALRRADFVADPFLFYEAGTWYMFFEVGKRYTRLDTPQGNAWGRIAVATSLNGTDWEYDRLVIDNIVLNEAGFPNGSVHRSYPQVIKHNGQHYMVTESYQQRQIRFYRATDFPYEWEVAYHIAQCGYEDDALSPNQCIESEVGLFYVDPSIFHFNHQWWLIVGASNQSYVYFSDDLLSGWEGYEDNPVASGRPGGRVIIFDDNKIIRFVQSGGPDGRYGYRIKAYQINTLNEDDYVEEPVPGGTPYCADGLFCGGGEFSCTTGLCYHGAPWNNCGMHHFDAWWTGDQWIIATDGYNCYAKSRAHINEDRTNDWDWAIGIYRSPPPPPGLRHDR